MSYSFTGKKRIRKSYGRDYSVAQMPNLLEVQKDSYQAFLDKPEDRKTTADGLQEAFESIFPIQDTAGIAELDFVNYEISKPKFDVDECLTRDMTFAAPLKATLRLVIYETDEDSGARSVKDIKEQEVYLADLPMMTEHGTFVINGNERVIVSQVHRSPGVFFGHDNGTTHASGKLLFNARIIPHRGSWFDYEFDHKDNVHVRIDRRRKLPATYVLRALGMTSQDILDNFYDKVKVKAGSKGTWHMEFTPVFFEGVKQINDVLDAETGEVIAKAGKKLTKRGIKKAQESGSGWVLQSDADVCERYLAEQIVDKSTGEVLFEAGAEITADMLEKLREAKVKEFNILKVDFLNIGAYVRNTLQIDKVDSKEEALIEIFKVMRPGEPPTVEAAETLFNNMFFDADRYDLSPVGRMKLNARLEYNNDEIDQRTLREADIIDTLKKLLDIRDGRDVIDDIDHLGNRRIRSVGELMENQVRIGLLRMERSVRERMANSEIASMMPRDVVNARPLAASMREFFSSTQLSQFMDQTNPLSEVTHKRRISALGPGGLTRERAGFEVRDVHTTHYGRICPIETPEGPNIGLINSFANYSKVNKYGFIETPYRKVVDCKSTDEVVYLSAIHEKGYNIAQAGTELDDKGNIVDEMVIVRRDGETIMVPREQVDFMDVSPRQVVSVASALIPFLENDDANRALMGSNMMRQAVPLMLPEAPLVGTGMEAKVAKDSGAVIVAKRGGVVNYVDAGRIVVQVTDEVKAGESGVDIYRLTKYKRTNHNTSTNQRPLVKVGDTVSAGDIMADGAATEMGELALGRNVCVAFMPWNGYNFEDSILISERIARDDVFTSIHIDEMEVMARDTKLGSEEITRDIPNVGEEALKNLDEAGIIRIGANVKPGDILVGKITPKGETPMTPEEKLLRAIFGEKAADVRDTSLRMHAGVEGTVVGVKVFNRRGAEKDARTLQIEEQEVAKLSKDIKDEREILESDALARLSNLFLGQKSAAKIADISKGAKIEKSHLDGLKRTEWWKLSVEDEAVMQQVDDIKAQLDSSLDELQKRFDEKVEKIKGADELSPGVLKLVKVFIAVKRKLQPGDKMAGRHGNKGVISRICPLEDMPYMEDGRPVDICLNPLGVPSRMNVGQILETHLGWAAAGIGRKISEKLEVAKSSGDTQDLREYLASVYKDGADLTTLKAFSDEEVLELAKNLQKGVPMATPVFDGASEDDISTALEEAGFERDGQLTLFDGRTGEKFDRKVTVGYIYMLKLHHLVDEKIHARSIGPYSLVTQQPLGGKAQFGGQRFGEMEVWALEAYGASYTLQEMLTVKSDDVSGRTKTYEAIVRGEDNFEAGVPESFNVLVKEMQALGLNVETKSIEEIAQADAPAEEDSLSAQAL